MSTPNSGPVNIGTCTVGAGLGFAFDVKFEKQPGVPLPLTGVGLTGIVRHCAHPSMPLVTLTITLGNPDDGIATFSWTSAQAGPLKACGKVPTDTTAYYLEINLAQAADPTNFTVRFYGLILIAPGGP